MRLVERYFWLICLAAIALGLVLPGPGTSLLPVARYLLMAILFFTCLKIDWHEVAGHLRRPFFVAYAAAMMLVVLPAGIWAAARLTVPAFTLGVVILAAMPSGMAASSLTHVAGGNAALALVGTAVTTLLAPITVPLMVRWLGGEAVERGTRLLLTQTAWLTAILFTPAALAALVRRLVPGWVERQKSRFTGLSIIALGLLIFAIVAPNADQTLAFFRQSPGEALGLFGFTVFFSAALHLSAFVWAYWRPWPDRLALSVNAAYVNNGLALTFAMEFFAQRHGPAALLPAIAVEVPMVLGVLVLRHAARRMAGAARPRAVPDGVPGRL